MKILPVSYNTPNNYQNKQSFNGKLGAKVIPAIDNATQMKIKDVGIQYSLSGKKLTQDVIDNIKATRKEIINRLQNFMNYFHDDIELRLVSILDKETGENNVFFALSHPNVPNKLEKVCLVDFDSKNSVSLDSIEEASKEMMAPDVLCKTYIENVHRHFMNSMLDNAVEQVKNNYEVGLIGKLTNYITGFSQFSRNGDNNYAYVNSLLKAARSEKLKELQRQLYLNRITNANTKLVNRNLKAPRKVKTN